MRKPNKKSISDDTKRQILVAAWELIESTGRVDVGLAEIADRAGVSRQALFYAFGNRAGLLLAMVRHKDTLTPHVARISAAAADTTAEPDALLRMAEAWIDYVPVIYPVGILLDAAALTDAGAAQAWNDRMIGALLTGLRRLAARARIGGDTFVDPVRLADEIWAEIHPAMWRRLVIDCGWSADDFHANRLRAVRRVIAAQATGDPGSADSMTG